MLEYIKIQTVFKRDPDTKYRTLLNGEYSLPIFDYLKNNEWIFTEKIDGTNIRVIFSDGKVSFEGRTNKAQIPAFLVKKLMELFTNEKMATIFPDGEGCLYGEGYGAKIQKDGGNYIPDGCNFILFDVMIGKWWLNRSAVQEIANKLEILIVPIISTGTLADAIDIVKNGYNSHIGDCKAEGLVMRPAVEMFSRDGRRVISKIKYKDFICLTQ